MPPLHPSISEARAILCKAISDKISPTALPTYRADSVNLLPPFQPVSYNLLQSCCYTSVPGLSQRQLKSSHTLCQQDLSIEMAVRRILNIAGILSRFAHAIPTIDFPPNSQVPPVARINEPFSFTFSSSTFSSNLPLTYTLSDAPSWLSLESSTRIISGTPSSSDISQETITGVVFGLTASDTSGSVTSNVTIVISKNPAPTVTMPVSLQLSSFGTTFEVPSTLLFHPSTSFNFSFNPGTFTEAPRSSSLGYYAVCADNAPLPSWMSFDEKSLGFIGETPDYASLIEPPQTFAIQLIASDVEGFSGSSISFAIEVGVHLLAFKNEVMVMNATAGTNNDFDGLSRGLNLDGQQTTSSGLTSIAVDNLPSWLRFDNSTLNLSGNPPRTAISSNITVHVTDIYGDTANATVYINVSISIFSGTIGSLNATIGSEFSYNLSTYLCNPQDVSMGIVLPPTVTWVSFDSQTFMLTGQVPSGLHNLTYDITINATSISRQSSETQPLILTLISGSSGSPTPSNIPPLGTSDIGSSGAPKGLQGGIIAAIVVPTTLVASLLIVLFAILWYRHVAKDDEEHYSGSDHSFTPEAESSVVDILKPAPVAKPEPLPLDTSGFGDETASSIYTTNSNRRSTRSNEDGIRRSQTISVISSIPLYNQRRFKSMGSSTRAYTDNTLSKAASSRKSIGDDTPLKADSRIVSPHRLSPNYSNYSRKGHTKRSRVWSTAGLGNIDDSTQTRDTTIHGSRGSNITATPRDDCSLMSTSIPEMLEGNPTLRKSTSMKIAPTPSTLISHVQRAKSGHGHGVRELISTPAEIANRRSIGRGLDGISGLVRDSRIRQMTNFGDTEKNRCSYGSSTIDYTDIWSWRNSAIVSGMSVYSAPKHAALARLSQSSVNSRPRPISRRIVGQSPFLSGRPFSRTSRSPPRIRTSFADSPTVPEEEIMSPLHKIEPKSKLKATSFNAATRDRVGPSALSTPREGTKQLQSYIQTRLQQSSTRSSIESRDSRFESACPSMQSLHQTNSISGSNRDTENQPDDEEKDDYLSEEGWETDTQLDKNNVVIYDTPSPRPRETKREKGKGIRKESPKVLVKGGRVALPLGKNARMVSGRGKRPISVENKGGTKGSVRARLEKVGSGGDFPAYI